MLLALYGAEVVKLEPPEGDWSRRLGTTYGNHSALSLVYNRGKRGLCMDLKTDEGRRIARALAVRTDILIEGFRPGVAARLGLAYDSLNRENPALIYVSVSGFGQSGPYAALPCSDSVAQAFSGLISINVGADGMPHRVGATLSDVSTGLFAFQAVATSLYARQATGLGRWLDIDLTQSTAALLGHKLAEHVLERGKPRALNAPAGSFQTRDGWIMVTLVSEEQYGRLCHLLSRPDLADDPRFANFASRSDNAATLISLIQDIIKTETTSIWLDRFKSADIIAQRILDFGAWLRDPHIIASQAAIAIETPGIGTVYVPRTPGSSAAADNDLTPAPDLGQHSRAILADAGLDRDHVEMLIASGVVHVPLEGESGS
jgi:crotonobetainyl-CoA:carnitine CoA-transferase CaiB-like acyl-CoA transferase